jgi:hypothetical protein
MAQRSLHLRVVISLLAERLEKPPFCHSYTTFGVWSRDDYMPLQWSSTGVCHALLWFVKQTAMLVVLRFPAQTSPLAPCGKGNSQSMSQSMMPFPTQPSKTHYPSIPNY